MRSHRTADESGVPPGASTRGSQRYAFPRVLRATLLASSLFLFALGLGFFALAAYFRATSFVLLVFFGGLGLTMWVVGAYSFLSLPALKTRVEVDESGLTKRESDDRYEYMRWSDVGRLDEQRLLKRLDVVSISGATISVSSQLEGFAELRSYILRRTR